MYEIGDTVMVHANDSIGGYLFGKIINWYYDEGNVWLVQLNENNKVMEYGDHELCGSLPRK